MGNIEFYSRLFPFCPVPVIIMAMKKSFGFVMAASLASIILAGCDLSPGEAGDYFRVDLYSDYEGIDSDLAKQSLKPTNAKHLGYCYAKKGGKANIDGLIVIDSWEYHKSTRTAPSGYTYQFASWNGFYEDGKKIDLNVVTAACSVYATFDKVEKSYAIALENSYQVAKKGNGKYQSALGDVEGFALTSDEFKHDPLNFDYDPYYKNYTFDGYTITTVDDANVSTSVKVSAKEGFSKVNEHLIGGKTTVEVNYIESLKDYTVTINPVFRDEDDNETSLVSLFGEEELKQTITYDEALAPTKNLSGYVFLGYEGTYGEDADSHVKGHVIDPTHIRYHGEVKAVYVEEVPSREVLFHLGATSTKKTTFHQGGMPILPDRNVEVPDKYAFTGYYAKTEGSYEAIDFSSIFDEETTLDAYPIFVPLRLAYINTKKIGGETYDQQFTYRFDRSYGGYMLENYCLSKGGVFAERLEPSIKLSAEDFWDKDNSSGYEAIGIAGYSDMATILSAYEFVGVSSFTSSSASNALGSAAYAIEELALPNSVKTISSNGFALLSGLGYGGHQLDLSGLDLEYIGPAAFRSCINLKNITLPKLSQVDARLFAECDWLSGVEVGNTEDELSTLIGEGKVHADWNKNGDVTIPVTYAA